MKVLVACEFSGIVREAFRKRGHDAWSCDLLPTEIPGQHYQGCLENIIGSGSEWDMIIAFPPCTFLCVSGYHWNYRIPGRGEKTIQAVYFVNMIWQRKCPKIVIENPVGILSRPPSMNFLPTLGKPSQIIQPYQFGHDASKKTCLWLKGLPPLKETKYICFRVVNGKPRWSNQTDGGQNKLAPSPTRAMERSRTYQGIADAMAEQWG